MGFTQDEASAPGEAGSGSVLAVALVASVLLLAGLALPLNAALTARQLTANAADSAALAAADTASGLVPGYPCANAAEAARLNGAVLGECTVNGLEVLVTATRQVLGIPVSVRSRAGPSPPG
ncbi:Rv3654c family TadE-like protein [Mycetocola miduiensis]|uniref:Helicase/secretion neighborhood TadE-like protein n=1 Tax=Mycetocola miduiensis TaxID=995034 RepID=A0A1I4YA71_9MICO|nr:Rv3654c family TadE-like protein [Mycetocola miduiensis]SFN34928.1 helicase/secretion neighborhood TadE-like protein [Mycetocola miduiensis]